MGLYAQWLRDPSAVDSKWQALLSEKTARWLNWAQFSAPQRVPRWWRRESTASHLPKSISNPAVVAARVPLLRELVLFHDLPDAALALVARSARG